MLQPPSPPDISRPAQGGREPGPAWGLGGWRVQPPTSSLTRFHRISLHFLRKHKPRVPHHREGGWGLRDPAPPQRGGLKPWGPWAATYVHMHACMYAA